jgi:hypothetical protein
MKIELEYPYNQDWKSGYLVVNPEGRKTVILFNSDKNRSSTAYARYLLAVKEGRYLTENEQADHKDTDKTNDSIDNLQILSVEEHKEKTIFEFSGKTYIDFICETCNNPFKREIRQVKTYTKYCSRECSYKRTK